MHCLLLLAGRKVYELCTCLDSVELYVLLVLSRSDSTNTAADTGFVARNV